MTLRSGIAAKQAGLLVYALHLDVIGYTDSLIAEATAKNRLLQDKRLARMLDAKSEIKGREDSLIALAGSEVRVAFA